MATQRVYGIDVSYYQGVINWGQVKAAGVNYVILRGGFGVSNVDTQFINNITGAAAAGIENIGVYWFSYARDAQTALNEVQFCLDTIAPYRSSINMPVYFDWEEASYSYVQRTTGVNLTPANIQEIARTWCAAVVLAGYQTGIYTNKTNANGWFKIDGDYLWDIIGCDLWYARYGANNEHSLFIKPAFEDIALAEHPETNILQYSDVGVVSGINSQRVDLNVLYIEVETPPEPEPIPEAITLITNNVEYVEVRDAEFSVQGLIDTASSIIWHSVYYGTGDFEVYTAATAVALDLLQVGRYVTRPNDIEIGIIERIEITDNLQDGKMIIATGRFAKSILDRRHIYRLQGTVNNATTLSGNVETAIRKVVSDNAIACPTNNLRNISILELGAVANIPKTIVNDLGEPATKQVTFGNLLEYTEQVLQEYEMAATVILNNDILQYVIYQGTDRSSDNAAGNLPIIFSKEYDNLTESDYSYDETAGKTTALIGGAGEDIQRFYAVYGNEAQDLARRETWVDASSQNRTYKDINNDEQTYSDADYRSILQEQGKQSLNEQKTVETFNGSIDITNGNYIYNRDFTLGDIVTIEDKDINKYVNVRLTEITEVQDENGYRIEANYSN